MYRYVFKRLLMTVFVIIAAAWVIFTIMFFVPGDPASIMLGTEATYAEILALREKLGLTGSYLSRLTKYLYNFFIKFDFGISWTYDVPVFEQLILRLPYTLIVSFSQMIFGIVFGIPLGIMAALHQNRFADRAMMTFSMVAISIPGFWLSLELVLLFSVKLDWLPAQGVGGWEYYIIPCVGMALGSMCMNARQTRAAVLEVVRADYITTARAKGLTNMKIILKHMLPNALLPIITMIGGQLGGCIAGSAITEQTFSIPGVGLYMLTAMTNRDYPVIEAVVILLAGITSVVMLLTDLAYAAIDPRIKAQYASGGSREVRRKRRSIDNG